MRRIRFRDHGAAEAVHGVFMRAAGAGGGLEEERVENLAAQQVGAGAHEGFQHFSSLIEGEDFVAGEIIEERDVAALHVGAGERFTDIKVLEVAVESHGENSLELACLVKVLLCRGEKTGWIGPERDGFKDRGKEGHPLRSRCAAGHFFRSPACGINQISTSRLQSFE